MNHLLVVAAADGARQPILPFALPLALAFHETRSWRVLYCDADGTSALADGATPVARPRSAEGVQAQDFEIRGARVVAATRALLNAARPTDRKPTVLLLGSPPQQRRVFWALVMAGLRPRVRLVLHVRAAEIPFRPEVSDLFRLADLIVVESAFGARAVEYCCQQANTAVSRPILTIPPPAYCDMDNPADSSLRHVMRRDVFRVAPTQLLVGCCAADSADPRALLAMRIFRSFADGLYWLCARCHRITAFDDDDDLTPIPTSTCSFCRATEGRRGEGCADARLLIVGGYSAPTRRSGEPVGWEIRPARRALSLDARMFLDGDEGIPPVDSIETLLARLSALDIHLLPHDLADVEHVLLAGCAMSVPTITTRFGAADGLLGSHVRLVAPRGLLLNSEGHWMATMEIGAAVSELLGLARSAQDRVSFGALSRDAMRTLAWNDVTHQWLDHIERLGSAV